MCCRSHNDDTVYLWGLMLCLNADPQTGSIKWKKGGHVTEQADVESVTEKGNTTPRNAVSSVGRLEQTDTGLGFADGHLQLCGRHLAGMHVSAIYLDGEWELLPYISASTNEVWDFAAGHAQS
jgi:hypothetical protein